MDHKMTHRLINLILLLLLASSCNSQKLVTIDKNKFSEEIYNDAIWIPMQNEESYNFKVKDTTVEEINLIFERVFDDSIKVFLDSKEIFSRKVKTLKNSAVVDDEFKVNYVGHTKPLIEIFLIGKNKRISFSPKKGYAICYVNRTNNLWSLEFSNYQRMYY